MTTKMMIPFLGSRKLGSVALPVALLTVSLSLCACGGSGSGHSAFSIAVRVAGLRGAGLVLQNNGGDDLDVNANGTFTFAASVSDGGSYSISVLAQPSNPGQNCVVTNGSGTATTNVSDVLVGCVGLWTWVGGSSMVNGAGYLGAIGVPSPGNVPGSRYYAFGSRDSAGDFWLYGGTGFTSGGEYGGLDDLWRFSLGDWVLLNGSEVAPDLSGVYGTLGVPSPASYPGWKRGAVSWTDASGKFWCFGGAGNGSSPSSGWMNDLWMYSPSLGEWTWMGGASIVDHVGVYGTQGTPGFSNIPGARADAVSWTDAGGIFWLFGGMGFDANPNDSHGWLNDLWKYSAGQWTWVGGSNSLYQPGVYGTLGVVAPSNFPGGRMGAVAWTDPAGNVWLFGGFGHGSSNVSQGDLNDLWKYSAGEWTWMSGSDSPSQTGTYGAQGIPDSGNVPGGREYAVGWSDSAGNLWLFGGDDAGGSLNDLWKYSAGRWTWMGGSQYSGHGSQPGVYGVQSTAAPTNNPGVRTQAVAWTDAAGNLWLFGGNGNDSTGATGFLNDLWQYK